MINRTLTTLVFSLTSALALRAAPPEKLELKKGEHIAIVGNALADRMQHDGTLEAFIHGASAATTSRSATSASRRMRSRRACARTTCRRRTNGSTKTKADVVLAFFGFNESFKGDDGLAEVQGGPRQVPQGDSGARTTAARARRGVVLFSPIAQEKLRRSESSRPDGEQREPAELHRGDGRGGEGERRAVRRSLHGLAGALQPARSSRSRSTAFISPTPATRRSRRSFTRRSSARSRRRRMPRWRRSARRCR